MTPMLPFAPALVVLAFAMSFPDTAELERMAGRFARTEMRVTTRLAPGERQTVAKLIEAAQIIDDIYLDQVWSGNRALLDRLRADRTPLGKARLRYFLLNKGPWSELDGNAAFLPGVPRRPPGANFYPEDMTKPEFERWAAALTGRDRARATGFFTVIRRDAAERLKQVPYSAEYRSGLERAAALLEAAAALTGSATLQRFLTLRAAAFGSDDYYSSDVAWMDLDSPVEVTIGPYETYTDELFGYKTAFEAYVTIRDDAETAKLGFLAGRLQEIEDNLPIEPRFRNPKLGAMAPIRVVNEVYAAGDGAHGVRTAAYNLPNDERVVREKGSKRVMLRNVQQAKFRATLTPIAERVLSPEARADLSFDAFFTHIVAHELAHGLGPHQSPRGTPRQALKEHYSALEEAKADATGLFLLQHFFDRGNSPLGGGEAAERRLYTTYLASTFRSVRFGLHEAHGRGTALQVRWFRDRGAFLPRPDGTFAVDVPRMKAAVRELVHELLTIEANGDYEAAGKLLERARELPRETQAALQRLNGIPTDIEPVWHPEDWR
jgi:hypothetical protein